MTSFVFVLIWFEVLICVKFQRTLDFKCRRRKVPTKKKKLFTSKSMEYRLHELEYKGTMNKKKRSQHKANTF